MVMEHTRRNASAQDNEEPHHYFLVEGMQQDIYLKR